MTIRPFPRRRGASRRAAPLTIGLIGAVAVALASSPAALGDAAAGTADRRSASILLNLWFRNHMELLVVVAQVVGLLTLSLARLAPTGPWTDPGRRLFVVAMIALGASGALCAWYGSEFALFAGAALAVLFILGISGPGLGHHAAPARR